MENASMALAIGLVAVVWLASRRFNTPRPVRTYTKATRYFWGCTAYAVAGVVAYAGLELLVRTTFPQFAAYAALAAVALLGLAVRLPGASRLDRWARESLQRAIGYPSEAHRLAAALAVAPFIPDPAVRDEVKFVLRGRGYELDDAWLPVAEPIRELWFRAAALFQQVRGWERDPRFGSFAWAAHDEFDVLRHRFDQLSLKVVRVLETIEQLGGLWVSADGDAARADRSEAAQQRFRTDLRAIVSRLLADLRQDLAFFNHNLCLFAARGILTECVWAPGRQRQLARLGFELPPEGPSTTRVLAFAFLFYVVVFAVFLTPILTGTVAGLYENLLKITMIALTQVLAVAIAVVPKQLFGFANENLRGETPWGYVLGAGIAAALLAVPLQFAFFTWLKGGTVGDVGAMTNGVRAMFAWLVMPFATAASLAFLIQDGRWGRIGSPFGRRLADVLVLVGALGLALCAVRGLQYLLTGNLWAADVAVRNAWLTAVIAAGLGYMIPDVFRRPLPRGGPPPRAAAPPSPAHPVPSRASLGVRA
jgi:hypothetical protein